MNTELRTELQYCLDQLGENDLEINNLINHLRNLDEISCLVQRLIECERLLLALSNDIQSEQLLKLATNFSESLYDVRSQIGIVQNSRNDHSRNLQNICGRNHKVFMTLANCLKEHE